MGYLNDLNVGMLVCATELGFMHKRDVASHAWLPLSPGRQAKSRFKWWQAQQTQTRSAGSKTDTRGLEVIIAELRVPFHVSMLPSLKFTSRPG